VNGAQSLRAALNGPDFDTRPLRLRKGQVTATAATTPATVTVRLSTGVTVPGVCYIASYTPAVGDVVFCVQAGPVLVCFGTLAGTTPPAVAADPWPLTDTTATTVTAASSALWTGTAWSAGTAGQPAGVWLYGTTVATVKGAGTITAASVLLERAADVSGPDGPARVMLGTHAYTTLPGGAPTVSSVAQVGTLDRGQRASLPLTAAQVAALNAGATGVGTDPAAVDAVTFTGRAGSPASGQLTLTVTT
jgi:hypothetical protein